MPPAARVGDQHQCPNGVVGVLLPQPCKVLIGGLPAATITTPATPCFPGPNMVVKGSSKVLIGGLPAARMGDTTAHGSIIIRGEMKVLIGG
jgi:uncharacterized Zn-binding protein involved in type VI secretion